MNKKQLQIEFDANGDMREQSSGPSKYYNSAGRFEPAVDFDDQMEFVQIRSYYRKDSRVILRSRKSGTKYSMYLDDFSAVIIAHRFTDNKMEGTWRFMKKGTGQAVKLLLPPPPIAP